MHHNNWQRKQPALKLNRKKRKRKNYF